VSHGLRTCYRVLGDEVKKDVSWSTAVRLVNCLSLVEVCEKGEDLFGVREFSSFTELNG